MCMCTLLLFYYGILERLGGEKRGMTNLAHVNMLKSGVNSFQRSKGVGISKREGGRERETKKK